MLNYLFISLFQLEINIPHICENNFTLQGSHCTCLKIMSSNGTLCVQNCSDINENEVDGVCSTMKALRDTPDCSATYGPGFEYDNNEGTCYCPSGVSCKCKAKECCNLENVGMGYSWDNVLKTCECPSGSVCYCTSEYCCQKQNLHYINARCDTCEVALGTGYTWSTSLKSCECPSQSTCACKTQLCCALTQKFIKNGQCTSCDSIYKPISNPFLTDDFSFIYCGCNIDQKQYGSLQNTIDTCIQCSELMNDDENSCLTCEQGFGPGYVWDSSLETCQCPSGVTCECKTALCCFRSQGTHFVNGKCQTCKDQHSDGAILDQDTGKCICDSSKQYYGTLTNPTDKCQQCAEYYNTTSKSCKTCLVDYGNDFVWSAPDNKCVIVGSNAVCKSVLCCNVEMNQILKSDQMGCDTCPQNTIVSYSQCVCDHDNNFYGSPDACQKCEGLLNETANTCLSCSHIYGSGYAWSVDDGSCYCPPGTKCDCLTEYCCWQNSTHLIDGKCNRCLYTHGTGFDWDYKTNSCFCRNLAICECISGLTLTDGVCKDSSNKTGLIIGLAVGIPLVVLLVIAIIIIILKKKQKKQPNEVVQMVPKTDMFI
ncbi:Hypothetical_protein [Hexamita inflata]|uniref:Hypothetical_protein n=1 Tax=Hexamita inflata TaxID=28002 RepID=A0AA86U9Q5_9EUKA|nr:Hypothetical protein HINF_LOCUS36675 [Hexamita inflata]